MKNLILLLLLTSCATKLKPSYERSFSTTKTSTRGFSSALAYLSTAIKSPDKAIKFKDKNAGLFVLESSVKCNELRQFGDPKSYLLKFTLTAQYKNGSLKLDFQNMFMANLTGEPVGWSYNQISSKKKLEEVKPCLNSLIKSL